MEVFLFRYTVGSENILHKAVIVAWDYEEAEKMLLADYNDFGIEINIEEFKIVQEEGVVLTWHEPVRK